MSDDIYPVVDIVCACGASYHQHGDPFFVNGVARAFVNTHKKCAKRFGKALGPQPEA